VADVDLECVEPALYAERRAARVVGRDTSDVGFGRRRAEPQTSGLNMRPGVIERALLDAALATGPGVTHLCRRQCPIGVDRVGDAAEAVDRCRPQLETSRIGAAFRGDREVRDGRDAAPPAATLRWNSTSWSVTTPAGVAPSKVAALMTRFRNVSGRVVRVRTGGSCDLQ